MNKAEKFIARLNKRQRDVAIETTQKILSGDLGGLNIKKLQGFDNVYRVRKGDLRFVFKVISNGEHQIVQVTFRDDTTYNF